MVESERALLKRGVNQIGLNLDSNQISQLIRYLDLLEKWNLVYNLTAISRRSEMLGRHLLESLAIASYLKGESRLDLGTGAGLPGIPLAIADPENKYTLIDSNGKKTRFLQEVKRQLGLSNIEVITARAEAWEAPQKFQAVLTRAFADLLTTCIRTEHLLAEQGCLFAMKSAYSSHEIVELPNHIKVENTREVSIPGRDHGFQLITLIRNKTYAL